MDEWPLSRKDEMLEQVRKERQQGCACPTPSASTGKSLDTGEFVTRYVRCIVSRQRPLHYTDDEL